MEQISVTSVEWQSKIIPEIGLVIVHDGDLQIFPETRRAYYIKYLGYWKIVSFGVTNQGITPMYGATDYKCIL